MAAVIIVINDIIIILSYLEIRVIEDPSFCH